MPSDGLGYTHAMACPLCGLGEHLIVGPGAAICLACVALAVRVIETGHPVATPKATIEPVEAMASATRCRFCGQSRHQVAGMASAGAVEICADCLQLCSGLLAEELG